MHKACQTDSPRRENRNSPFDADKYRWSGGQAAKWAAQGPCRGCRPRHPRSRHSERTTNAAGGSLPGRERCGEGGTPSLHVRHLRTGVSESIAARADRPRRARDPDHDHPPELPCPREKPSSRRARAAKWGGRRLHGPLGQHVGGARREGAVVGGGYRDRRSLRGAGGGGMSMARGTVRKYRRRSTARLLQMFVPRPPLIGAQRHDAGDLLLAPLHRVLPCF